MKTTLMFFILVTAIQVNAKSLLPSTLESITYDSMIGGAKPPPNTPRPQPIIYMSFTIKPVSCLDDDRFKISVKELDNEKEVQIGLVYLDMKEQKCHKPYKPKFMDMYFGLKIQKRIKAFNYRGKSVRYVNPLFVKTSPPRP